MVYERWNARIACANLIRQARPEGWYQQGPAPSPAAPGEPDREPAFVRVAHGGATIRVYVDRSDAEATLFLARLDPRAPGLCAVRSVGISR